MRTPTTVIQVAAGLTSAALVAGAGAQMLGPMLERTETQSLTYPAAADRIEIGNGVGSVHVRAAAAGEEPRVEVSSTWGISAPRTEITEDDGTARLTGSCTRGLKLVGDVCRTDWVLVVPRDTELDVENGVGEIEVDGTSGELSARTGVGQLRVTGSTADEIDLSAGVGDIRVESAEAPSRLDADVGVGGLTVVVPRDETYRVTFEGPPSTVKNEVGDDPSSDRRIHVRVGVGEARITDR